MAYFKQALVTPGLGVVLLGTAIVVNNRVSGEAHLIKKKKQVGEPEEGDIKKEKEHYKPQQRVFCPFP